MAMFRKIFTPSVEKTKERDGEILDLDYRRKVEPSFRDSFGRSQIHKLLLAGCDVPDDLDYLITHGCEVNLGDSEHNYPIHIVAEKGLVKCAKKLIQKNSLLDIFNDDNETPLMLSVLKGHSSIVCILLQNGANPNLPNTENKTALHYAALGGNVSCLQLLLEAKGKVNKVDKSQTTPLVLAAKCGQVNVVKHLIASKTMPKLNPDLRDAWGRTAIHWACEAGLAEIVQVLCEARVELNQADSHYSTPFILAVRNNRARVLEVLVQYKVDRSTPDGLNGTCLGMATLFGHTDCVKVLLNAGEDPHESAYFGVTPLMLAAFEAHCDTTDALLEFGADPEISGRHVGNPLMKTMLKIDMCNAERKHHIIRSLLRAGVNPNATITEGRYANYCKSLVYGRNDVLSFAVLSGYRSIISMLLIAGVKISRQSYEDILNGPLSTNGIFVVSEILEPIRKSVENPTPLSHVSRMVIRNSLGPKRIREKVKSLPVATRLKDYLNLKDLDEVEIDRVAMKGEFSIESGNLVTVTPCVMESFKGTLAFRDIEPQLGLCSCEICTAFSNGLS